MKVTEVTDGMRVVPNQVFVIPPNTFMTISDHTLHLAPRGDSRGVHMSAVINSCVPWRSARAIAALA